MKTALVFGLGLIGNIAAEAITEIGYKVIGVDIAKKNFYNPNNKNLIDTHICDATNENDINLFMKKVFSKNDNPFLLINAMGVDAKFQINNNSFAPINNQDAITFNHALNQGLTSYFLTSKYFVINHIRNNSKGRILNIASDLSVFAPDHRIYNKEELKNFKPAHYGVVKHGVVGLTKYFSATFAPQIIVNSLSPSGIFQDDMDSTFVSKLSELTPMNRMIEKEELIKPIQFLCNKENSFLTGQNIIVDGGRSII